MTHAAGVVLCGRGLCVCVSVCLSQLTMAGIVASTLRRKAFHRGARSSSEQSKAAMAAAAAAAAAMATDGVQVTSCSPSASRRSSRSSSFAVQLGRSADSDDRSAVPHASQVDR